MSELGKSKSSQKSKQGVDAVTVAIALHNELVRMTPILIKKLTKADSGKWKKWENLAGGIAERIEHMQTKHANKIKVQGQQYRRFYRELESKKNQEIQKLLKENSKLRADFETQRTIKE